ncbi:MAG: fused MFS/spermidine synthase [Actinobacteria bacterium]|nr:fused MFS/spermidine synthase [Actinomycetota bacterium]
MTERSTPAAPRQPALPWPLAVAIVFASSAVVLVLETLAGRLLAPYVGVTLQTFTGIIGVVLAGIAVGTWQGGRLADRFDARALLPPTMVLGGGLSIASVPLIRMFGSADLGGGQAAIVFLAGVAFFLPSVVLSAISPMVVTLQLADIHHTGRVVGRLSAVSTFGSLVGVFVTGFVLIAAFPTTPLVLSIGGALVAAGAGLWWYLGRPGGEQHVMGLVVFALGAGAFAITAPQPCQVESAYFCVNVLHDTARPSGRILLLDDLRHSYVDLDDPTYLGLSYAQTMSDVLATVAPAGQSIVAVHIGGGGFTMPRYLEATRPGTSNTVLEVDPTLVDVAEDELGLVPDDSLDIVIGDARVHLRDVETASADLVIGDAFGGQAVPWHLTTKELIEDVQRVLRDSGVYTINLIDRPPLGFARAEVATLRAVFAHVAVVAPPDRIAGIEGGNFVLVASDSPIALDAIAERNRHRGDDDEVVGDRAGLDAFTGDADVLTDEHAPVDQLLTPEE